MKLSKFTRGTVVALMFGAVLPIVGIGVLSNAAGAATTYTATSTDGTVFTASSLQDAQVEAAAENISVGLVANPTGAFDFAGFNQSVCMEAGEHYNGDFTKWLGATASATANCQYNSTPPTTLFCYKVSNRNVVKAEIGVDVKCPAGYTKNIKAAKK